MEWSFNHIGITNSPKTPSINHFYASVERLASKMILILFSTLLRKMWSTDRFDREDLCCNVFNGDTALTKRWLIMMFFTFSVVFLMVISSTGGEASGSCSDNSSPAITL